MTSNSDDPRRARSTGRPRTPREASPTTRLLVGALVVAAIGVGVAACDTRSNKDLNGVATFPMGGPAHGAWQDPAPATTSTTETTTTTTTVRTR